MAHGVGKIPPMINGALNPWYRRLLPRRLTAAEFREEWGGEGAEFLAARFPSDADIADIEIDAMPDNPEGLIVRVLLRRHLTRIHSSVVIK